MKKLTVFNNLSRTANKVGFKIKKFSPEILVFAGIAGAVTSTVMACKATLKANDIIDEMKDNLDTIHEVASKVDENKYSEEDLKKDTTIVYTQTAVKFIKLYGPSVILGTLSIASIVKSHNILSKRNAALAAAYATVDKGFNEYRERVIAKLGKDLDFELRNNIKAKEFEETVTDDDGNETVVKTIANVADPNEYSSYARFFDDGCRGWCKDAEYNLMFLKQQQNYANDLLKLRGHLFLNEVYDMLGIPRTKAGQVVGWVYDEKNPFGDNFVDFGIYNIDIERARAFVNGYERSILLDFNVDGNIYDLL